MKPLIIKQDELPLPVVILGQNGEREVYQLTAASRRLGASLQKLIGQVRDAVLRMIDHK